MRLMSASGSYCRPALQHQNNARVLVHGDDLPCNIRSRSLGDSLEYLFSNAAPVHLLGRKIHCLREQFASAKILSRRDGHLICMLHWHLGFEGAAHTRTENDMDPWEMTWSEFIGASKPKPDNPMLMDELIPRQGDWDEQSIKPFGNGCYATALLVEEDSDGVLLVRDGDGWKSVGFYRGLTI